MPERIITREDVAQKLRDWASGTLSSEEMHTWAESLFMHDDVEYEDWERDEDSVTNEVLGALDMLNMNLVLPEDAPIYLEFLSTPAEAFHSGHEKMEARLSAIDFDRRKIQLRDVPLYAPFLRSTKA